MNQKKATSIIISMIVVVAILSTFELMTSRVAIERTKAPVKPEYIPASAEWFPRSACQIWIDFHEVNQDKNQYYLTIYEGANGEISYSNWYKITENFDLWDDIKNKMMAYDGEVLYLTDGRELHPV